MNLSPHTTLQPQLQTPPPPTPNSLNSTSTESTGSQTRFVDLLNQEEREYFLNLTTPTTPFSSLPDSSLKTQPFLEEEEADLEALAIIELHYQLQKAGRGTLVHREALFKYYLAKGNLNRIHDLWVIAHHFPHTPSPQDPQLQRTNQNLLWLPWIANSSRSS